VTKIENVNFDKHRLDFDQHYSHLKKGDNRLLQIETAFAEDSEIDF